MEMPGDELAANCLHRQIERAPPGPFRFGGEGGWTNPPVRQIGRKADLGAGASRQRSAGPRAMDGPSSSLRVRRAQRACSIEASLIQTFGSTPASTKCSDAPEFPMEIRIRSR